MADQLAALAKEIKRIIILFTSPFYFSRNRLKEVRKELRILTTDIYEGAYLLSEGMELKNIWEDKTKRKRSVVFEFNGSNIEILRSAYLRGRARANVLKFKTSVNELKDIMFNLIRDNELRGSPQFCKAKQTGGLRKEIENEVHRIPITRAEK